MWAGVSNGPLGRTRGVGKDQRGSSAAAAQPCRACKNPEAHAGSGVDWRQVARRRASAAGVGWPSVRPGAAGLVTKSCCGAQRRRAMGSGRQGCGQGSSGNAVQLDGTAMPSVAWRGAAAGRRGGQPGAAAAHAHRPDACQQGGAMGSAPCGICASWALPSRLPNAMAPSRCCSAATASTPRCSSGGHAPPVPVLPLPKPPPKRSTSASAAVRGPTAMPLACSWARTMSSKAGPPRGAGGALRGGTGAGDSPWPPDGTSGQPYRADASASWTLGAARRASAARMGPVAALHPRPHAGVLPPGSGGAQIPLPLLLLPLVRVPVTVAPGAAPAGAADCDVRSGDANRALLAPPGSGDDSARGVQVPLAPPKPTAAASTAAPQAVTGRCGSGSLCARGARSIGSLPLATRTSCPGTTLPEPLAPLPAAAGSSTEPRWVCGGQKSVTGGQQLGS